jgi:uncharacterized membrane protein (UPF0127 family)
MRYAGILLLLAAFLVAGCSGTDNAGSGSTASNGAADTTTTGSNLRPLTIDASGGETVRLQVEIADTDAERQRGLMERTALGENRGMLFLFEDETTLSFWMKNTLIPLSVAYIDSEGRIVDIQDMQPLDETSHPSAEPAQYALEVNQGFFKEHGVEVGDTAELPV